MNLLEEFRAVHAGHAEVRDDEPRLGIPRLQSRETRVAGLDGVMLRMLRIKLRLKIPDHCIQDIAVVINKYYAFHMRESSCHRTPPWVRFLVFSSLTF